MLHRVKYWLYNWYWITFLFIYLLLFWPNRQNPLSVTTLRASLIGFFLIFNLVRLYLLEPEVSLAKHVQIVWKYIRHERPLQLAVAFAVWTVILSTFATFPLLSWTGDVRLANDGALWWLATAGIFLLVYLKALRNPKFASRLTWTYWFATTLLSLAAIAEVVMQRSIIEDTTTLYQIPYVNTPGRGHLAGVLLLAVVLLSVSYVKQQSQSLPIGRWHGLLLFINSFALGMTRNRSALVALLVCCVILLVLRHRQSPVVRWRSLILILSLMLTSYLFGSFAANARFASNPRTQQLSSTSSLQDRFLLWQMGWYSFQARLLGWGGGLQFTEAFDLQEPKALQLIKHYLVINPAIQQQFAPVSMETIREVVRLPTDYGYGVRFFLENGRIGEIGVNFKIHNYFLDVAVSWGVIGLLLQLSLLLLVVRPALRLRPAAVALLVVHVYLLAWYAIEFLLIPLWIFWALALVPNNQVGIDDYDANAAPEAG